MRLHRQVSLVLAVIGVASVAWGITNSYEPRGVQFAGRSDDGPIRFSWTGAELRVDQRGGVIEGELRLKVWGDQGGCGQVFLCVDLRAVPPHPELPACRDKQARLMPLCALYDGPLTQRGENRHERKEFLFRVNMPKPFRMHDLRLIGLRAPNAVEAVTIIREDLTIQELRDHGEEMGLEAVPEHAGKEAWNAANMGRLYLLDGANEWTVPYWQRYPEYPRLFRPLLPPEVGVY